MGPNSLMRSGAAGLRLTLINLWGVPEISRLITRRIHVRPVGAALLDEGKPDRSIEARGGRLDHLAAVLPHRAGWIGAASDGVDEADHALRPRAAVDEPNETLLAKAAELRLAFQAIIDDLVFDRDRTTEHEAALAWPTTRTCQTAPGARPR